MGLRIEDRFGGRAVEMRCGRLGEPLLECGYDIGVESVRNLVAHDGERLAGAALVPVGAWGSERLIDIGHRDQPCRQAEIGGGQAARVATAVEALVMRAGRRREALAARDS